MLLSMGDHMLCGATCTDQFLTEYLLRKKGGRKEIGKERNQTQVSAKDSVLVHGAHTQPGWPSMETL